jgi:pimeloyl-ACP methyl ester carboxylesterase
VLCAPSLLEPLGQSILEGMACGLTVVATRVGGPPEFVPPEAGLLVDPLDAGELARALEAAAAFPSPNEAARAAAARLLCAGRPGYADTSPASPGLGTVVEDVRSVVDELGLTRFGVLGVSGGGPYAAAVAARLPERVTGLALLAGVGPAAVETWGEEPAEVAERRAVALAQGGRTDEAAAVVRDLTTAWFDEVVRNPRSPLPDHLRAAMVDGDRRGHEGPVFDRLTTAAAWDVEVDTVVCPTTLVYGGADPAVPREHGEWYQAQIPHAVLTVVPGADHPRTIAPAFATVLPWLAGLA